MCLTADVIRVVLDNPSTPVAALYQIVEVERNLLVSGRIGSRCTPNLYNPMKKIARALHLWIVSVGSSPS